MFHDRYRCLECNDYDLCGMCFDQRCETHDHHANHVMVDFTGSDEIFGEKVENVDEEITLEKFREKHGQTEHEGIECSHCHSQPIKGLFFKCDSCRQYYLCFNCMKIRAHHPTHTLLAMSDHRIVEIPVDDLTLFDEIGRGGFGESTRSGD